MQIVTSKKISLFSSPGGRLVPRYNGYRDDRGRAAVPEREPAAGAVPHRHQRQARHQGQGEAQHRLPGLPRPVPRGGRGPPRHRARLTQGNSCLYYKSVSLLPSHSHKFIYTQYSCSDITSAS